MGLWPHGLIGQGGLGAAAALRVKQQGFALAQLYPFGVAPGRVGGGSGWGWVAGRAYGDGKADIDAHAAARAKIAQSYAAINAGAATWIGRRCGACCASFWARAQLRFGALALGRVTINV